MFAAVSTTEGSVRLLNNFSAEITQARDVHLVLKVEQPVSQCAVSQFNANAVAAVDKVVQNASESFYNSLNKFLKYSVLLLSILVLNSYLQVLLVSNREVLVSHVKRCEMQGGHYHYRLDVRLANSVLLA